MKRHTDKSKVVKQLQINTILVFLILSSTYSLKGQDIDFRFEEDTFPSDSIPYIIETMDPEEGLIDIIVDLGFVNRLSPRELRYEGFKDRSEWNYFLLTTNTLNPVYDASERESEILTEDFPGHYVDCLDFEGWRCGHE